jgi:site-specific DNA recombinase
MADRKKQLRCAIYTRKSSEEGLEQDFNSLDAQREACEAYVASQKSEGWTLLPDRFDDGGFSGGTLDRPALQQLLADIEGGRVDVIVVYKIDRLSRSLMDFAKLVEVMDRKNVTFVSVTQSFNTTTSMGRLTLNILLSFAQFEREVTGERIRDKIAASKKKGMWMGGHVPIGYDADDRSLSINEAEAETVRAIFSLYLETGNVRRLQAEAVRRGLTTKRRVSATGTAFGGRPFSRGHIYKLLSNPLYVGEIEHKGTRHPGQHPPIIDRATFDAVQARLRENTRGRRGRANAKQSSLLSGLLFDETGNRLTATHAVKNGRRYRYYVTSAREDGVPVVRLSASAIEPVVVRQVAGLFRQAGRLIDEFGLRQLAPDAQTNVMASLERLCAILEHGRGEEQRAILADLVEQVTVGAESLRIDLKRAALAARLLGEPSAIADHDYVIAAMRIGASIAGAASRPGWSSKASQLRKRALPTRHW